MIRNWTYEEKKAGDAALLSPKDQFVYDMDWFFNHNRSKIVGQGGYLEKEHERIVKTVAAINGGSFAFAPILSMDSAPKIRGLWLDLIVKSWDPAEDKFLYQRIPNCYYREKDYNAPAHWVNVPKGSVAVGWSPAPNLSAWGGDPIQIAPYPTWHGLLKAELSEWWQQFLIGLNSFWRKHV